MTTTVRAYKGLMTKRSQVALAWLDESAQRLQSVKDKSTQQEQVKEYTMAVARCDEYLQLLEASLTQLTEAFDKVQDTTDEEEDQLDKHAEIAQETIMKLYAHKSNVTQMLQEITTGITLGTSATGHQCSAAVSKLPTIPIPTFTGKKWEWDNFWAIFKANVHDQDLTELKKFNYLLSSLSGEAKQSISRFFVSASNYEKAIQHLAKRYGNKDGTILELNKSLQNCVARGPSTADQRQLCDKLSAIATQLEEHEQHLSNQITIQIFLQKFHVRVRKAAMEKLLKHKEENNSEWTLDQWLNAIDDIISQEEQINHMLSVDTQTRTYSNQSTTAMKTPSGPTNRWKASNPCECCGCNGHRWINCSQIPTAAQKKSFLLDSGRCLNCGSIDHRVASCLSGNCRKCNKKHHTAICSEVTQYRSHRKQQEKPDVAIIAKNQLKTPGRPCSSLDQHVVTETIADSAQKATECSEEGNPSVLMLRGKLHTGSLSDSSLDNEATKKAMLPTSKPVVNGLKRQAGIAPLSLPILDDVQPLTKRSSTAIANATLLKDKNVSSSSPDSNLYMQSSVHSTTAEAHVKPAVLPSIRLYSPCRGSDISDDTSFTKTTAESEIFATRPDLSLNVRASANEGETIRKVWQEFSDFKKKVKRQQQDILDSIQRMSQYLETFKAWGMENANDVIQQEIQEKKSGCAKGNFSAEQQLSKARKEKANARRDKKQNSSEEKRWSIPAAPTRSQKGGESKRSCTNCKRKHTQNRNFSRNEKRNHKPRAQMKKIKQNPTKFPCTQRHAEVNVNCQGSRKQHSDDCLKLNEGTRRVDVQHKKKLYTRGVVFRHSKDRTQRVQCFYCSNTRGNAAVLNHHDIICRLLKEIAHKQRKPVSQAKTFKDNMKMITKRKDAWNEKKRTMVWSGKKATVVWNANKRRPKANGTTQIQSN